MAGWALAEAPGDNASRALAAALHDPSDDVRAIAAWALGQRPQPDKAPLLAAISDRVAKVREAAIWGAGNQDLEKAPAPVTAALRDAETPVRLVAAWALSQIGDPDTAPALRAAFKDEKNEEVREALFHALMLVGDRSPDVIEQMIDSKDPDLRSRAVHMMSRGGGVWPWPWPRPDPRPMP
jgi:HEAT repeat protein